MIVVSQLDESQLATFGKFKEAIKDCTLVDSSDDYKLKWLVAREFDVEKAEKMLRQSIEWRRANRIDEIIDNWEAPVVLVKYYPMSIIGKDKSQCPVWIVNFGRADWRGMLQSVTKRDYVRYVSYLAETSTMAMRKNSANTINPVTYQTFIIDMEELSMHQMSYKPFRDAGIELIKISEANYPESLRRVFIINAPKIFTFVFAMIKPFLNEVTHDKIAVYGFDKSEWSAALLKEIDADQLPVYYGGSMTDPNGDPKCPSKLSMGGEVPSSYYLSTAKPTPKSDMVSMSIPSGSKKKLEFKIIAANSLLRWEFMTEDGDIGFSAYYLERNGDRVDLFPNERVECHLRMEEGEIICVRPVLYVLEFDNSFSYMRSKKLWHRVFVDLPGTEQSY